MASSPSFRQILGVPPSTASTADSTLIIIDAQNEYAEGKLKVTNVAESRKVIASLLQKYRDAKGKVVHVVHEVPEGAPIFTPKTRLAEVFEELTPLSGEKIVVKHHPGSFAGTDLQEVLNSTGSKKVVLVGYMVRCGAPYGIFYERYGCSDSDNSLQAHVCISTTARQAAQRGYDVVVVEDAVGDRNIPGVDGEQLTWVALCEIGDVFGTIVQSKDIK
jgi:nicotinamidase-related amidase